jgi:hypothetical protein
VELLDHGANLARVHDRAADGVGRVVHRRVELLVPLTPGVQVDDPHRDVSGDAAAPLADYGPDAHEVEVDVHAVGDGLPVGVLADQVLVEEPEGLPDRCGGEPDQVGVEVFEHLAPLAVDRPVALVNDHQIERL